MERRIIWIDIEAADYKVDRDGAVHDIAYIIDIDGEIVKKGNIFASPFKGDLINMPSLEVCGVTHEQIMGYPPPEEGFKQIVNDMHAYKRLAIGGFNCQSYDFPVFINWWYKCARALKKWDIKWIDYVYPDTIDVRSLSIDSLLNERDTMKDFKLMTVAEKLGVNVSGDAHTALFDIEVTRDIYYNI
jgi:hypothetical protein